MDNNFWIVFVITPFFIFFLYKRRSNNKEVKSKERDDDEVPLLGSLGWPLIGETIQFLSSAYSHHPETFVDKRRHLYGKVFKSHIFGSPTIISTDADVNKFILQSDAKLFVPSYPKSVSELMGKSSILLVNGSLQRKIHGLVGSFFKSQITTDMHNYVQESMANWSEESPIYIQDETKKGSPPMARGPPSPMPPGQFAPTRPSGRPPQPFPVPPQFGQQPMGPPPPGQMVRGPPAPPRSGIPAPSPPHPGMPPPPGSGVPVFGPPRPGMPPPPNPQNQQQQ
ncbi:hypothetical protein HN51_027159 [Arachis hypogaea]|uniref:Uncharacterized protein n=1 Tax=Arachis hypogaea TaxID=3818 RepID=A0A445BP49_ARAHY|nr:3-epi-6-deoxocathasterone 23-monooxygenase [Arachis hypogaea]RYR40463.1 hypothetical protein Ahy_A09g046220 isoform A [Arachis hypogaea]